MLMVEIFVPCMQMSYVALLPEQHWHLWDDDDNDDDKK